MRVADAATEVRRATKRMALLDWSGRLRSPTVPKDHGIVTSEHPASTRQIRHSSPQAAAEAPRVIGVTRKRSGLARLQVSVFEEFGDKRRDRRTLGSGKRDMGEQRMALELLYDRNHTVVPPHPQVVALPDIVS
jgi:hypothetical protein